MPRKTFRNRGGGKGSTKKKVKTGATKSRGSRKKTKIDMNDMLKALGDITQRRSGRSTKKTQRYQAEDHRKAPETIIDKANKIREKMSLEPIINEGQESYAEAANFLKGLKTVTKDAFDKLGDLGDALSDALTEGLTEDEKKDLIARLKASRAELHRQPPTKENLKKIEDLRKEQAKIEKLMKTPSVLKAEKEAAAEQERLKKESQINARNERARRPRVLPRSPARGEPMDV